MNILSKIADYALNFIKTELIKIIQNLIGFAGYKDIDKTKFISFLLDNFKFITIILTIIIITMLIFAPQLLNEIIVKLLSSLLPN